jgi:hypothetical protein
MAMTGKLTMAVIATVCAALCAAIPAAQSQVLPAIDPYNPQIVPDDFSPRITNRFFALRPGTIFLFENPGAREREEMAVLSETKVVMGVTTAVVRHREWRDDRLKEDTVDWYAQHKDGTVWYFGEAVAILEKDQVVSYRGSWEAGVDGALPGIIMLGDPKIGSSYRQGQVQNMKRQCNCKNSVTQGNYTAEFDWLCIEVNYRSCRHFLSRPAQ